MRFSPSRPSGSLCSTFSESLQVRRCLLFLFLFFLSPPTFVDSKRLCGVSTSRPAITSAFPEMMQLLIVSCLPQDTSLRGAAVSTLSGTPGKHSMHAHARTRTCSPSTENLLNGAHTRCFHGQTPFAGPLSLATGGVEGAAAPSTPSPVISLRFPPQRTIACVLGNAMAPLSIRPSAH